MNCRLNTPHTDKIEMDFLEYRLQLTQDPNSKHLGTTVWDSSIVFVKFLEQNCKKGEFSHTRLVGKRVVELGAGCGLAGLGMSLLGCHVVATDQVEVLPLLMRNLERNLARARHSPSESPYLGSLGSFEVAELDWGNEEQINALRPPFDYIIGSDIVYKEQLLEPLLTTLLGLAGPKTTILLANEYRSSSVHEKMLRLWKENFNMKMIPRSKMDPKYQHEWIQLFSLKSKVTPSFSGEERSKETVECKSSDDVEREFGNDSKGSPCESSADSPVQVGGQDTTGQNPSNELNDWEIRRLGSMAARLLQNTL